MKDGCEASGWLEPRGRPSLGSKIRFDALESIDRSTVVLGSVFEERIFPLVFGPGFELRAVAPKLVEWDAVATGVRDTVQMDLDERPDADGWREECPNLFEFQVIGFDDGSQAVEANNFWRCGECAEHQDDPFIFFDMRHGLDAAAGQIKIDHRSLIDDSKGFPVFG